MKLELPADIQALFAKMQQADLKAEEQRALGDPRHHKLSRVFAAGMSYHYLPIGVNRKNQQVSFCWSVHRNVAGYFLSWRQTRQRNGVLRRDRWAARKTRKAVRALAERRANAARRPTGEATP